MFCDVIPKYFLVKGFTQDILSEKRSRHIVSFVGEWGINTVAEGVETQVQVNCLFCLGGFRRPEKVEAFCCEYKQRQRCNR